MPNKKILPKEYLKWADFFGYINYQTLYSMWECLYFTDLSEEKPNIKKFFDRLEEYLYQEYKDIFKEDKKISTRPRTAKYNNISISGKFGYNVGINTSASVFSTSGSIP